MNYSSCYPAIQRSGVVLGALLLSVLNVPAAALASPADLPVTQIIDRNITARGGLEAWHRVQTLTMSGMMDAGRKTPDVSKMIAATHGAANQPRKRLRPEMTGQTEEASADSAIRLPYLIELRRPNQMRVEVKFKDDTAIQVYDGKQGWKLRPFLGRRVAEDFSAEELKLAARQQELDGPLVDYAAKGTKVESAGVESVDGHDAYKLKLTLKTGDVINVWVDAQSFLDVKIEAPRRYGKKQLAVATYMRDYRKVNGLLFPFRLEDKVEGSKVSSTIDIEQIAVNSPIDDSRFTKPN